MYFFSTYIVYADDCEEENLVGPRDFYGDGLTAPIFQRQGKTRLRNFNAVSIQMLLALDGVPGVATDLVLGRWNMGKE